MPHQLQQNLEKETLSVGEYLEILNTLIQPLRVNVVGEVSDLRISSQWVFFALKDEKSEAALNCGLHTSVYHSIGVPLEDGMQIKVGGYGKVTPKSGRFGFWVSSIEPVGEGALRKAYELLLAKLKEEGLFARRRPLPEYIEKIGVISSRDGAVLQDLLKNLAPLGFKIYFAHSLVEGAGSAGPLAAAILQMSRLPGLDVLVIIRGGGSLESLQGFNNETVARAIFASNIPVIAGIGHEVDAPIAAMVADAAVSTPTAVAHLINSGWDGLIDRLPNFSIRLTHGFETHLSQIRASIAIFLRQVDNAFGRISLRFSQLESSFSRSVLFIEQGIDNLKNKLAAADKLFQAVNPENNLRLGYSIVTSGGRVVKSINNVKIGETVNTRLSNGNFDSEVKELNIRGYEKRRYKKSTF